MLRTERELETTQRKLQLLEEQYNARRHEELLDPVLEVEMPL